MTTIKQLKDELRESEERFKSLFEFSSDWYWEQDADFKFTLIMRNAASEARFAAKKSIGKTRWELPYVGTTEEQWDQHKALLNARQPFYDLVLKRYDATGNLCFSSISGAPVFDVEGNFKGYRGVGKDITARKQGEQREAMEHAVTRLLAESKDLTEAMLKIIQTICETSGWHYGAYWGLDKQSQFLRRANTWSFPSLDVAEFIASSQQEPSQGAKMRSHGVRRRAWATGEPVWVSDVTRDPTFRRAAIAAKIGLHAAFAFPILVDGVVFGVMEFYSREVRQQDELLLRSARSMGAQIGQFYQRKQGEQREAMEHAVTRVLAEFDDPAEIMPKIIQAVCETLGWDYGAYWGLDKQSELLRQADTWHVPSIDVSEFVDSSRQEAITIQSTKSLKLGGIIRRAWLTKEPLWIVDVTRDPTFRRAGNAARAGLQSAFAFPVLVGRAVLGVMEFFNRQIHQADELLLRSLRSLGSQIGQFYQRKQIEARQAMEHVVTRLLAESGTFDEAMPKIIQTICETLGWDYGGYWSLDEQKQVFRCTETWITPSLNAAEFVGLTLEITNASGTGGAGVIRRVLASAEPIWVADVTQDTGFWRGAIAAKIGLRSAFAFPILIGREIIGVMEFFSHNIRQPDEILIETARSIGIQIGQFRQRKQAEERIQYLAYYDGLTGLPNRTLFSQRLNHALAQAQRYKKALAVLFIDLDRFKNINDTLGHEAGDSLLQEMAKRLADCLRESDTVARLGGDEFVVLLEEVADPKYAANVARKIIAAALNPFLLKGGEYHITASIGISTYPDDGEDEQTLMKHADIAMYLAKDHGKNNYQFYSAQINAHSFERLALESSLRHALERNEFLLHYQPKIDMKTGDFTGMEALIRWQHPDLGMVSPALFIPLAEETGLIVPIGRWVLKTACAQNKAWQEQGLPRLRISVNLSARQFTEENLVQDVARVLEETGLEPELLELEITESMVMYNPDQAVKLLSELKAMGLYVAIDDFGIGYSSLSQLKRFPIDTIKVDRSFIKDLMENRDDAAITEAIIAMGKSLNLNVIAEGVETSEQVNFLRDHQCDEMQGYYFSKPIPENEFADLLREHKSLAPKARSSPAK